MAFVIAAVLLMVFVANVTMGAFSSAPFFGNVIEMLVLFGASIAFVAGILRAEARQKSNEQQ